jgi:hypothetical protein
MANTTLTMLHEHAYCGSTRLTARMTEPTLTHLSATTDTARTAHPAPPAAPTGPGSSP